MKHINILLIFCLLAIFSACKKEEIEVFDNDSTGIYFQQGRITTALGTTEEFTDSMSLSFTTAPLKAVDTVLKVRIRTMGKVKDFPRVVKLAVNAEKTTAIAGQHYDLDFNSVIIPAGASEFILSVKFKRTADLIGKNVILELQLEDNENFKAHITTQKNTNVYSAVGKDISANKFKFIVGEIYVRPFYWYFVDGSAGPANNTLGPWSVNKYKFINSLFGWTPLDWQTAGSATSPVQLGRFVSVAITARNTLQALANAGTPVLEADGSKMQLGPDYLIVY